MDNSELLMLKKLLEHKSYEDNGIVYTFYDVKIVDDHISLIANADVPEGRGWNHYMLEFFAYNIINEKIKFVDIRGLIDVKLRTIYVNGTPIKEKEYYLPPNLETKLENIFKKLPDFGISYKDFGVLFEVEYKGLYDIENDDYQIVVNCGFNISKIILKKYDSDKKVVIKSVPQDLVESMYSWLMEDTDTEMEELRYHLESEVYSKVFSEAFSLHDTEENYISFYLIPQWICGKEITLYSGGDMDYKDIEEYFRKLVSKSIK
jgi:hypothetical protein